MKWSAMAKLFKRRPKTDIILGLIFIAQAALELNNYYDHYKGDNGMMILVAWCVCGICGVYFFVRGLLRI
jgi:hypothetical protein